MTSLPRTSAWLAKMRIGRLSVPLSKAAHGGGVPTIDRSDTSNAA